MTDSEVETRAKSIIENLRNCQLRSDSPTDFEVAIRDAFSFLGFECKLIGGKGDTDVLLTANIGQESFKANIDGKTSKSGKIIDSQIDWLSLRDHKKKNNSNFVIVVGPDFSGGNLEERAKEHSISLLQTNDLIQLIEAHEKFPFTLIELKDLFSSSGDRRSQLEDLLVQNRNKLKSLEQFKIIIEEMQSLQDIRSYFTLDSLAARDKIVEQDIEPKEIETVIQLLEIPFINGIKNISEKKYIIPIQTKDIANIFQQISNYLITSKKIEETTVISKPEVKLEPIVERKFGTKYFKWEVTNHSVVAVARQQNPYTHYCPIPHFQTIINKILAGFKKQNVINNDLIFSLLKGQNLAPERPFKGTPEEYKIRMALGILELEGLIKWTGSKKPIEYILSNTLENIEEWINKRIIKTE